MKTLTVIVFVVTFVSCTSGYLIRVQPAPAESFEVFEPTRRTYAQKLIISLFENVCEPSDDSNIIKLSQEFTINDEEYLKPDVAYNLRELNAKGLLRKDEIFSEYNPDHMSELKIISELLFNANNFDIFYKAAAWARQNLNCGLYVSAIYMAIQCRKDTSNFAIPAPYEVLPNYFVQKDVIIKASSILAGQNVTLSEGIRDEGNTYTIDANYTANFYDNNDDSKLAYFLEDIGLNSYYYLRKLKLTAWLNNDINSNHGEEIYQMMKQFMARFNLERYANELPEINSLDWNSPIDVPYDPMLVYSDGSEFAHRTSTIDLPSNEDALLETIENNIAEVVRHMWQSGYNKTQILNHIMEILVTNDRSYETLARQRLGKDVTNNRGPSVLEHYMTSLRDPIFWRINKNIVNMVDNALKVLPPYAKNELFFPGVEVLNIELKKIMTSYDYFEFDVTDALKSNDINSTLKVKINQPRLSHKPFTMKINISSLVTQKGLFKIFIGPKVQPGEFLNKKHLFTLFDTFEFNIIKGYNIISRSSNDMTHFSDDFMSLNTIRKKIEDAEFGLDSLPLKSIESQFGYPARLILPKGSSDGLPVHLFVFVAPLHKANLIGSYSTDSITFNEAILSRGYPLDLDIDEKLLYALPNAFLKSVTITHKGGNKVNYAGATKQTYDKKYYDPTSRQYNPGTEKVLNEYSKTENEFQTSFEGHDGNAANLIDGINEKKETHPLSNLPRLLMVNALNTDPNFKREPFDYKTKKYQFDKQNYSGIKKDYSQYKTKPNVLETTTVSLDGNFKEDPEIGISEYNEVPTNLLRFDVDIMGETPQRDISKEEEQKSAKKVYSATKNDYMKNQITQSIVENSREGLS